jgi:hypothetical protein
VTGVGTIAPDEAAMGAADAVTGACATGAFDATGGAFDAATGGSDANAGTGRTLVIMLADQLGIRADDTEEGGPPSSTSPKPGKLNAGSPRQSFQTSVPSGGRIGRLTKTWSKTATCTNRRTSSGKAPRTSSRRLKSSASTSGREVPAFTARASSR